MMSLCGVDELPLCLLHVVVGLLLFDLRNAIHGLPPCLVRLLGLPPCLVLLQDWMMRQWIGGCRPAFCNFYPGLPPCLLRLRRGAGSVVVVGVVGGGVDGVVVVTCIPHKRGTANAPTSGG